MSFCQKCGAPLEEGTKFCTICGNPVEENPAPAAQQTEYADPAYNTASYEEPKFDQGMNGYSSYEAVSQVEAPVYGANYEVESMSKSSMVLGIIGLVLCNPYTALVGLILSIIALSKAKKVMRILNVSALSGKAKAGHIMGKLGIVFNIIMMVMFFLLVALGVFTYLFTEYPMYY